MTSISVSGLPALAWEVGFIVVGSMPVWFAAKITGATYPTLIRSALALFLGTFCTIVGFFVAGSWGFVLAPICYLFAFKFVLGTSFTGAFLLGIIALFGYCLMVKFIGAGFSVDQDQKEKVDTQAINLFVPQHRVNTDYLWAVHGAKPPGQVTSSNQEAIHDDHSGKSIPT